MVRGSCLCGGMRFEAEAVPLMTCCHCSKCRKAHGAAFRTGASIPLSDFRFTEGAELIASYQTPSGYNAPFCRVCGSNAPLVNEERKLVFVPAGLFDDDPGVRPALHIFVASKAPWHDVTDDKPQFDEWPPGFDPDKAHGR